MDKRASSLNGYIDEHCRTGSPYFIEDGLGLPIYSETTCRYFRFICASSTAELQAHINMNSFLDGHSTGMGHLNCTKESIVPSCEALYVGSDVTDLFRLASTIQ
jgi:hypothetical protein